MMINIIEGGVVEEGAEIEGAEIEGHSESVDHQEVYFMY
jgi:hypothetical protein